MSRLDDLLEEANPVRTPPPGTVTPAQELLLASIVSAPRHRRLIGAISLLVPVSALAAVAAALVLLFPRGAAVNDETEATPPAAAGATADAALVHVVTRLYGTVYGPGYGERLDGWLEPSTGRARIVITTGGKMTLQQIVGADDRFRSWQGALGNAGGITEDRVAPRWATHLRAEVRDRMASLIASAKDGFRRDGTTFGAPASASGKYRGRPVTVHRIAPMREGGAPSDYYFKWYTDPDTGEVIAFERGPVGADGNDVVEMGEELQTFETFTAGEAPLHQLDWRQPPATESKPSPPPSVSNARPPESTQRRATPTPTPTPRGP
jgi:hypothetical protein